MAPRPKKLLDQVCDALRLKNYDYRTEQTYVDWIERFIRFHNLRHLNTMNNLEAGYAGAFRVRMMQELLGHKDVSTTMVYTHVLNKGPLAPKGHPRSPLD